MSHFLTFQEMTKTQLDSALVGGKANVLAQLYQNGFPVPDGFVITTEFFDSFSKKNIPIKFSDKDTETIYDYVDKCSPGGIVAVRSSASVEDSNLQSFAGQFDSFLNIDKRQVLRAIEKCWWSIRSDRSKNYAKDKYGDRKMAVIVQKMIMPEIAGVAFSTNPITGDKNSVIIEAVLGSNEPLVQGAVTPDYYVVSKSMKILNKRILPQNKISQQKISDQQLLKIAQLVIDVSSFLNIEVDVEWAIGNEKLYILQGRPITAIQSSNVQKIF